MGDEKRRKLKQEADACGIELSYGIGLTADMDVSSLDEATRQRGVAFMKDIIRAVSSINGKMISGTVHSYWPASPPAGFTDKQPVLEQSLRLRRNVK